MYERFTDESRKCMQIANEEAEKLGHKYVGNEHIFLALTCGAAGVPEELIKLMGIDLQKLNNRIRMRIQEAEVGGAGRGNAAKSGKAAIENAMKAVSTLNHNYVGTEHLLLGLITDTDSFAARVLAEFDVSCEQVWDTVRELFSQAVWTTQVPVPARETTTPIWPTVPMPFAIAAVGIGILIGATVMWLAIRTG